MSNGAHKKERRNKMLTNRGPNMINVPAKLMTPEKAELLAAELRSGDEDWSYVVKQRAVFTMDAPGGRHRAPAFSRKLSEHVLMKFV